MVRMRKPTRIKPHEDYEARDALHTLTRAEEIKGDAKLMGRVREHAKVQKARLMKFARKSRSK